MPASIRLAITSAIIVSLSGGCGNQVETQETRDSFTGIATVYTVNYPLKYFADRIGGEHVNVVFPAPADEDPAYWRPNAETVAAYQQADLILLNGATYAKWVPLVTLPESRLVDTTEAVRDKYIVVQDAVTHTHGTGEEHSHTGIAFTTWLDLEIAIAQANAVYDALLQLLPVHQRQLAQNFASLKSDLRALDKRLRDAVNQATVGQAVVCSHPVFQYLERKYGLNAKSVHWEPDSLPSHEAWAEFRELIGRHPAKWMIWEGKPNDEIVARLAELGVQGVVFNPCSNTPGDGDWLQVMERNAIALARVYAVSEN